MLLRFPAQIKRAIHMWWTSSLRCINNILCVVQITYWETLAFKTLKWLRQQVSMDQFFLIFIETFCNVETRTWLTCFLQNSPIKYGKKNPVCFQLLTILLNCALEKEPLLINRGILARFSAESAFSKLTRVYLCWVSFSYIFQFHIGPPNLFRFSN